MTLWFFLRYPHFTTNIIDLNQISIIGNADDKIKYKWSARSNMGRKVIFLVRLAPSECIEMEVLHLNVCMNQLQDSIRGQRSGFLHCLVEDDV